MTCGAPRKVKTGALVRKQKEAVIKDTEMYSLLLQNSFPFLKLNVSGGDSQVTTEIYKFQTYFYGMIL